MSKSDNSLDPSLIQNIKNIPKSPGIYMMLNKQNEVVYIGKAKNLKARVRSYLNTKSWEMRPKLFFMMPKVKEIKTTVTSSEKEALILEASLVNKHQPRYNVTLKDDKKFPWLMITYDESHPRVIPIRNIGFFKNKYPITKNKFFGPYSDASAMWETYKILKEGFKLRLRKKPLFKDRPCMNFHIGLCSGPCQKLISDEDYMEIVKQVEDFLLGKYSKVLNDLKNEMKKYSENLEYENALKIRNTIQRIEKVLEKQIVVSDDINLSQDIFACSFHEKIMLLELFSIREGKIILVESLLVKTPKYDLNTLEEKSKKEFFTDAIKQYYIRIPDENIPDEIITQYDLIEKSDIENWLKGRKRKNKKVTITSPKKGKKHELIKMAEKNSYLSLQKFLYTNTITEPKNTEKILHELKEKLFLKNVPHYIECLDISHLGGTNTVASMVCFIDGIPDKTKYRKFNIRSLEKNKIDDFESISEVILRRYKKLLKEKSKLPDLIIIDGGKGQLSSGIKSLNKITNGQRNTFPSDIVALAKKKEEIFKPERKKSIILESDSEALMLLKRVRDEAHRFAITFQRQIRGKTFYE